MSDITLPAIQSEIDSLTRKIDRLRATLEDSERKRAALSLTIQHFQEPSQPSRRLRAKTLDVEPTELQGKTLEEALIYIAEQNEGIVHSTIARQVLTEAGVLTGSQVGNRLWSALDHSERFTRESKGRYRLLDDPLGIPFQT